MKIQDWAIEASGSRNQSTTSEQQEREGNGVWALALLGSMGGILQKLLRTVGDGPTQVT